MQQIESFGQRVDEFLVLGGILAEIHLGGALARVAVILTAGEEVVAGLVVVLIHDGHLQLLGQAPAVVIVGVATM